jgi:hypothetical protein
MKTENAAVGDAVFIKGSRIRRVHSVRRVVFSPYSPYKDRAVITDCGVTIPIGAVGFGSDRGLSCRRCFPSARSRKCQK